MLDLFTETKQWKKAVEILLKLAGLEKGKLRAKYLEAAGNITNYELHAADEAIELYNQALDEDPGQPQDLRAHRQDPDRQEGLEEPGARLPRDDQAPGAGVPAEKRQTQVALWHALGEIYRSRLKDFRAAAQAFEVAVELEPDSLPRRQILAELYQAAGARGLRAGHRRVPGHHQAHRRLRRHGGVPQDAAQAVHGAGPVRPGLVRGLGAGVPAQGRPRGAAVLRAVQAQGLRPGQGAPDRGAVAAEHLPPRRGPLHLARAWRR